jgi:hypothetical protein
MVWIILWILSFLGFLEAGCDKAPLTRAAKAVTRLMPDSHNAMCDSRTSGILALDGFPRNLGWRRAVPEKIRESSGAG